MQPKKVSQSKVTMAAAMLPNQANPAGNIHGGEIMKLMDNTAGVVAQRHTHGNAVTARVDQLTFHHPIRIGNLVTCHGQLIFVGRSSMEIEVTVMVEDLMKEEPAKLALKGLFTFVALDGNGVPRPIPPLEPVAEEERLAFEEGRQRYLSRKQQYMKKNEKKRCLFL